MFYGMFLFVVFSGRQNRVHKGSRAMASADEDGGIDATQNAHTGRNRLFHSNYYCCTILPPLQPFFFYIVEMLRSINILYVRYGND